MLPPQPSEPPPPPLCPLLPPGQGACGTCAASSATMKMGIERSLKAAFGDQLVEVLQVGGCRVVLRLLLLLRGGRERGGGSEHRTWPCWAARCQPQLGCGRRWQAAVPAKGVHPAQAPHPRMRAARRPALSPAPRQVGSQEDNRATADNVDMHLNMLRGAVGAYGGSVDVVSVEQVGKQLFVLLETEAAGCLLGWLHRAACAPAAGPAAAAAPALPF